MTRGAAALLALVTLLLTTAGAKALAEAPRTPAHLPLQQFPIRLAGWQGRSEFFDPQIVNALHADDYVLRSYQDRSGGLWFYVAYYGAQPTDTRVHSPAVCLPGAGWFIAASATLPIQTSVGTITVNRNLIQKGDERQVVLYWYQIHGRVAARELQAISLLAWTALTERRTDEALARVNAPVVDSIDETMRREVAFVQAAFPELRRILP